MKTSRDFLPILTASVMLFAACGGDSDSNDAGTDGAVASTPDVAAPDATVPASVPDAMVVDTTMPDGGATDFSGMTVLDSFSLTFGGVAELTGSISLSGLAGDSSSALDYRCMNTGFLEVGYTPADPGEFPVEFFVLNATTDGPGTYEATITLFADVPAGTFPATDIAGQIGEVILTDDLAGTFSVDNGFGELITGSFSCAMGVVP